MFGDGDGDPADGDGDGDGDQVAEYAVRSSSVDSVYETTPSALWRAAITDSIGWSRRDRVGL